MIKKIPKTITLILSETKTIYLLDLITQTEICSTDNGVATKIDNEKYDYLTSAKGRMRKMQSVGVQTIPILHKTRHTSPDKVTTEEKCAFSSNWEMYDTYQTFKQSSQINETIGYDSDEDVDRNVINPFNGAFFNACLIIERLLANNNYNEQQKCFKGLVKQSPFRDNIKFDYNIKLLFHFSNLRTRNRCVLAIALNSVNEDIFAVGYGNYHQTDRNKIGIVMIWSIKNPNQPEREYYFYENVTSLNFSKINPNLLSVCFKNGIIRVLDISQRDLNELFQYQSEHCYESITQVLWYESYNFNTKQMDENLLASFNSGKISKFSLFGKTLTEKQITKVNRTDGRIKNSEHLSIFQGHCSESWRYTPVTHLSLHPAKPYVFFYATADGIIHEGSLISTQRHSSVKAHNGRVNSMKWSKFASKFYLTCGDDFRECLWLDGCPHPIFGQRISFESVHDIEWSPKHSTIFVSLRGSDIYVWDMARKLYEPKRKVRTPCGGLNTVCKFTENGECLIIGDFYGNVYVFQLEDMPMVAFFQLNAFKQALKGLLATNSKVSSVIDGNKLFYTVNEFSRFFD